MATCASTARASAEARQGWLPLLADHWQAQVQGGSPELVLDEPPQELHNRWIKDRVEYYKRVEPLAAPRDERLDLVGGPQNRFRFSTSNGLGVVSEALWTTILGNEEVSSLKMIHQVAMQRGRK